MSEKYGIAYNTGNDSLPVDDEGHMLAPREWGAVQRSKVAEHVASGSFVWIDVNTITNMSNPIAWEAKGRYDELNAAWEAEKAGAVEDDLPKVGKLPDKTDYDGGDTTTGKTSSTKRR